MFYKVYNELPGVWNGANYLISVIYYNVYNMMECGHQYGQMCSRGNTPFLMPTGTPDGHKCAAVAILHS